MKNFFLISTVMCSVISTSCTSHPPLEIGCGYISEHLSAPWHSKSDHTGFCCHSTADRFFFSFEVEDSTLVLSDVSESEMVVNGEDRVELFFSPDHNLKNGYFCAEIDAAGRIMDYRAKYYRKFDYDWNFNTMKAEGMVTPWGYRVAGSVSRDELESLGINLVKGFWMGVFRGDRLSTGDFEWYSLVPLIAEKPDFHVPAHLFECTASVKNETYGAVVYPDDITSLGLEEWEKRIDLSGIDVIGLHAATSNDPIDTLEAFIRSRDGQDFLALCSRKGVDVEYELHSLACLLPRELFGTHPEYFRADENGERRPAFNMCFSNEEAVEAMRPQLEKMLEWVKPTTHRYYFWADDKQDMFCHCERCAAYTPSEQILLYENRLLTILREYDPEASLAHLAYQQTETAPEKVRASSGIFLEYAPIKRDYEHPLSDAQTTSLRRNLMAFPSHTQHILEYWLDESMFSHWKKNNPVPVPFKQEQAERDINHYRESGAADFTCFATWLNARYIQEFGSTDALFNSYGSAFRHSRSHLPAPSR